MHMAPTFLLRIVVALVAMVFLFQLKLFITVKNIQANVLVPKAPADGHPPPPGTFSLEAAAAKLASLTMSNDNKNDKSNKKNNVINGRYMDCPFRDSSLVESIYVYPTPGSPEWEGDILSNYARSNTIPDYPWVGIDQQSRQRGIGPYKTSSQLIQYTTELLVRDIITHPDSCLRTYDPENATLFYIPYWPATEFHDGDRMLGSYEQTPYGKALQDAIADGNYGNWEKTFGLTSKYWQRRGGSDHIMVYSEPMHGLWHPRNKRGNYHFIRSQYQLKAPIAISVELSTTFVDMYPMCAKKNILMPYPNTDGRWFNGALDQETMAILAEMGLHKASDSPAALSSEVQLEQRVLLSSATAAVAGDGTTTTGGVIVPAAEEGGRPPRVLAQFYRGGNHGECKGLRVSMTNDYRCTPSGQHASKHKITNFAYGYRQATFCPCPGGDSPSAKRMYDALFAGCIPIILSHDFVWPFTTEFDRASANLHSASTAISSTGTGRREGTRTNHLEDDVVSHSKAVVLNPHDYSIRLDVQNHEMAKFDAECQRIGGNKRNHTDLQSLLDAVPEEEILRLRDGVARAAYAYSYYQFHPDLPDNPLREGILPDGGAAHVLVRALEERASGKLWMDCQNELEGKNPDKEDHVSNFQC